MRRDISPLPQQLVLGQIPLLLGGRPLGADPVPARAASQAPLPLPRECPEMGAPPPSPLPPSFCAARRAEVHTPIMEASRYGAGCRRGRQWWLIVRLDRQIDQAAENYVPLQIGVSMAAVLTTMQIGEGKLTDYLMSAGNPILNSLKGGAQADTVDGGDDGGDDDKNDDQATTTTNDDRLTTGGDR